MTMARQLAVAGALLLLFVSAAGAKSASEWIKEAEDERSRIEKEVVTAPQGGAGGPAAGARSDCLPKAPDRITLLGITSGPGPSSFGPIAKLDPQSPVMKPLADMRSQMGLTNENTPAAQAGRERKAQADTFAMLLAAGQVIGSPVVPDVSAWVFDGKLEAMARAYAEQQELARQYTGLYQAAEAVGRACP